MSHPQEDHLLACDLDGTLIPTTEDRSGIARFREALSGWERVVLAYVTGRHVALAEEGGPPPDGAGWQRGGTPGR